MDRSHPGGTCAEGKLLKGLKSLPTISLLQIPDSSV
jgi:hypothetical protein